MSSENPNGAENQQERLRQQGWVIGFVDGEGCFSIGLVRQFGGPGRCGYRTGYQVSHEFAVTQGAQSIGCLEELREFFGVGQVIVNRRSDNDREHLHRYVVRRRSDLIEEIIPFFQRHPLQSSKQTNFDKFARCVDLMHRGHHLSSEGLADIVEIMETMNRQTQDRAAQNPQRPYAERPRQWMMRWSHLHGDMQGGRAKDASSASSRTEVRF